VNKLKKFLIIILSIFILTGCTSINNYSSSTKEEFDTSFNSLLEEIVDSKYEIYNNFQKGYKYYVPKNMGVTYEKEYNTKISDSKYNYYFYVDVVSYYNRVIENYEVNDNAFYSSVINHKDKFGYIEINFISNDRYLLEIMYNYAKIEVMVDKSDLNETLANSLIILSSVKYNNDILSNLVGENILTTKEIEFNIFETKKTESNFLEVDANNVYVEEDVKDPDLID
jgi:hypothetical protein